VRQMRHMMVVLRKELLDAMRDKRSLLSALVFPLVGPLMVVVLFRVIIEQQDVDEPVRLPVVGAEHAPGLVAFLAEHEVEVQPPPDDPEAAVKSGEAPAVLVVPDDYEERFRAGKSVSVELLVDRSRKESRSSVQRVERTVQGFSAQLGTMRLFARGVDPQIARPVELARVDLATPQQRAADFLGMIPMFVAMAAFIGGMYVATDGTAGERERGSLEPLLVNPVDRRALAAGKWLATAALAAGSVVLTLVTSGIALSQTPLDDLGIEVKLGAMDGVRLALVMLPVALLAGGVQLVVATFARSFREAQTYLSLLMFVPMLPGMYMTTASLDPAPWMSFVPILGQQVLMTSVVRGEGLDPTAFAIATTVALAVGLGFVWWTAKLFGRERIIYGN
jgi:sodium transport system permease protein